jgi:hypothetical protein
MSWSWQHSEWRQSMPLAMMWSGKIQALRVVGQFEFQISVIDAGIVLAAIPSMADG